VKTKPRAIGTAGETAVCRYLVANGFPHAERRSLKGTQDQGDITGTPGVCWEIKAGNTARAAIMATKSSGQITDWLVETETERVNAGADVGVLVVQTPGTTDPGRWWCVLDLAALDVMRGVSPMLTSAWRGVQARLHLADVVSLLRGAGYGQALTEEGAA
jgi:hypothetical protein